MLSSPLNVFYCNYSGAAGRIFFNKNFGTVFEFLSYARLFCAVESYVGSSMPLWRVDRRQMGAFLCIASNDVPPAVSKRITLNVNCEYLKHFWGVLSSSLKNKLKISKTLFNVGIRARRNN